MSYSFILCRAQYPLQKSKLARSRSLDYMHPVCTRSSARGAFFSLSSLPPSPPSLPSLSPCRKRNRSTMKLPKGAEFNSRACATSMGGNYWWGCRYHHRCVLLIRVLSVLTKTKIYYTDETRSRFDSLLRKNSCYVNS